MKSALKLLAWCLVTACLVTACLVTACLVTACLVTACLVTACLVTACFHQSSNCTVLKDVRRNNKDRHPRCVYN